MRKVAGLALVLLAAASFARAQFWDNLTNPKVKVTLQHPPGLGLTVSKIAFGTPYGQCADQITDGLVTDFVSSQIEVVDRQHLDTILREHNFNLSGYVDQSTAAELGKIMGPSVLVFVKTQRCTTQRDRQQDKETRVDDKRRQYTVPVYISRTRAFLKASVQTIDLATGRIFAARNLEFSPEASNKSYDGLAEFPSEFDLTDQAIRAAVSEVHRMFLPWTERTELVFYDDNNCDLNRAYELLKRGDTEGAIRQSEASLEKCKADKSAKDKVLGHAYYNVGVGNMMHHDYDKAIANFKEAGRLRPGDIVTKAIAGCETAKALQAEMQKVEDRATIEQQKTAEATRSREASLFGNADVVKMVKAKLPDTIIIGKIRSSPCSFDTSTDSLIALKDVGTSDAVIQVMMDAGAKK